MVFRITTTKELYDIIDELTNNDIIPPAPVMIVLDEHQNYKEFIRIWPPYTVGNHLGPTSESWAFEVESEGPNFGKKFRGSAMEERNLRDRIIMYREQLRDHYLAVTNNPTRWDTPPDVQPYSTSDVASGWIHLKNNDTKKQYPTFLEEMMGVVKKWIGDKLSTEWRPSKGIIISGFVLLWIFLLSLMLTT